MTDRDLAILEEEQQATLCFCCERCRGPQEDEHAEMCDRCESEEANRGDDEE